MLSFLFREPLLIIHRGRGFRDTTSELGVVVSFTDVNFNSGNFSVDYNLFKYSRPELGADHRNILLYSCVCTLLIPSGTLLSLLRW